MGCLRSPRTRWLVRVFLGFLEFQVLRCRRSKRFCFAAARPRYVKASWLAAVAKGEANSPLLDKTKAVELLGTMQGGSAAA